MDLFDVDADSKQRRAARIEDHELVVPLRWRDVPLVAQPEIEGQRRTDGDPILAEEGQRALRDVVPPLPERDAERVGGAGEKGRHARKVERPGSLRVVFVAKVPVLAAGFHRVTPTPPADHVREQIEVVTASLRELEWPPEAEAAGHRDLRQPDGADDPVADPEVEGIELRDVDRVSVQGASAE